MEENNVRCCRCNCPPPCLKEKKPEKPLIIMDEPIGFVPPDKKTERTILFSGSELAFLFSIVILCFMIIIGMLFYHINKIG